MHQKTTADNVHFHQHFASIAGVNFSPVFVQYLIYIFLQRDRFYALNYMYIAVTDMYVFFSVCEICTKGDNRQDNK